MTQAGTARRLNEDSFQLQGRIYPDTLNAREQKIDQSDDYWQIYAVTDGMGGAGVGDIASRVVQSDIMDLRSDFSLLDPYSFSFAAYIQNFLTQTDHSLQMRLRKQADQPVGCSLALLMLAGETCYTMAIGSCRIYLYRGGYLYRMTEDHVLDDSSFDRPLLFLGNHPGIYQLRAQNLKHMQVQPGDHFFICTDGITDALDDEDIKWVLDKDSPIETYVESLFQNARRYDARDNQTILGLKIKSRRIFTGPESSDLLYPDRRHPGASPLTQQVYPLQADPLQAGPGFQKQATSIYQQAVVSQQAEFTQPGPQTSQRLVQLAEPSFAQPLRTQAFGQTLDQDIQQPSKQPFTQPLGATRGATGIYNIAQQFDPSAPDIDMNPDLPKAFANPQRSGQAGRTFLDLVKQNPALSCMTVVLLILVIMLFFIL